MKPFEIKGLDGASVSYEEAPIAETTLAGTEYRVDLGRGSAVAISQRQPGTWNWTPLTEGRWDGCRLRAKCLAQQVNTALATALGAAMLEREVQV